MPYCIISVTPVSPMQTIPVTIQIFADIPGTNIPIGQTVTDQKFYLGQILLSEQNLPYMLTIGMTVGGTILFLVLGIPPPTAPLRLPI